MAQNVRTLDKRGKDRNLHLRNVISRDLVLDGVKRQNYEVERTSCSKDLLKLMK